MAHREDTDMNTMEPPNVDPMLDGTPSRSKCDELLMRDHAVLPGRQRRDRTVIWLT
jgi:hypothetical protein